MNRDQELEYYIARYNENPRDYDTVAALAMAYRTRGMAYEAAQFENYLLILAPPPRMQYPSTHATRAEKTPVKGTEAMTLTCFAICLIGAFVCRNLKLDPFWGFGVFAFILLPSLIAGCRDTKSKWGVFALNIVFGWTGIGWFAAIIWAFSDQEGPRSRW